jgi:hypothetical protein
VIAVMRERLGNPMSELRDKGYLLENSGYDYHFERMIYRNRATKRAFSIEFVEDHSLQEIQKLIDQSPASDWVFHFNQPPPKGLIKNLIEALEK